MLRLSNVNLFVSDLERSYQFYTATLGLTVRTEFETPPTMRILDSGGCTLSLQPDETPWPAGVRRGGVELDFEVDDIDATFLRLKAAGVQIETEPVDHEFGRNFDARDPDGYRLTFFTFGPGAWATHADEQTE